LKVLVCFGTRPEAIKMAPVIFALKESKIECRVCVTGQHREMLDQVLDFFNIVPDYDLKLMKPNQSLNMLSAGILENFQIVLDKESPDVVMVQGDTTTAFNIGFAAFNQGVKIGHVEAGLRTYDLKFPFPEEANRQLISRIADYHFIPTKKAGKNLKNEMIDEKKIFFTGNTIIDALMSGMNRLKSGYSNSEIDHIKSELHPEKKTILVTGHRRENFEGGLKEVCDALLEISERDDVQIVFPVHRNPVVQEIVNINLRSAQNILLVEPFSYPAMLWMLEQCKFIISDSGGIQEEAPSFKKIVLVTRNNTERVEGVDAGFSILTGTSKRDIVSKSTEILEGKIEIPSPLENPFGDGKAAERIVRILEIGFQV
jgi:UDP-N-acetylglucosamine 2-epimerase (non-hydrolysing)